MAASSDYTDCSVLIYDTSGNHLGNTIVTYYDKTSLRIEVQATPPALNAGDLCKLLILSAPTPYEYFGRVLKESSNRAIALYKGQVKESRGATRYRVNFTAIVENLVCEGRAYPLHTPLEVMLLNISKSGVRFRTLFYALSDGDRFQMRMKISDNEKMLIAEVTNHIDNGAESSEYGCHFLVSS